ncbi:MAG: response regulator [Ignavibacteriales bacterium]|nr:response regulator [Ignavibacteriales bacterium]
MAGQPNEKSNILIVEDDYDNQKFLQIFLQRYFNVDLSDSSDRFYELMNQKKYDLILMDISIKGNKNGIELIRELKSDETRKNIPVICYTAHAQHKDRINALAAGSDVYISKPSDIFVLLRTMMSLINKGKDKISEDFSSSNFAVA